MAKYRILNSEDRKDGSGMVMLDVQALSDTDIEIAGRHSSVLIPGDDLQDALDKSNPDKEIYKLIDKNLPKDWGDETDLDERATANAEALAVDANFETFASSAGGYPLDVSK